MRHGSSGPIFIVGMNGSGTTMLLDHLDHHPDLFGFILETYILPHYLLSEHRYGDLRRDDNFLKLWNDMRAEFPFRRANKGLPVELPRDWAATRRDPAGVFDQIMRAFARAKGKERWCEKTPMHALHIERLAQAFPEARFIHMLRDGRACAVSCHRRWGRHPLGTIFRWKHVVAEAQRQGSRIPDRYLEVRYEEITNNPEAQMRRICEFIGTEFDGRVLSTSRRRPRMIRQEAKTIVKNQDQNVGYLNDVNRRRMELIAGKCLATLDYGTSFPDGNKDPSLIERIWWNIYDTYAVLAHQIRSKYTVDKNMTWSLFLARLKMIVRSNR